MLDKFKDLNKGKFKNIEHTGYICLLFCAQIKDTHSFYAHMGHLFKSVYSITTQILKKY